jgi:DNA-binding NtrC family response regulator/tetratricopeptide (TPR) repeat protein
VRQALLWRVLDLRSRYLRANDGAAQTGVCLAQDRVTGLMVVLKLASSGSDPARALELEGRLLADLEHPRLVTLTDRFVGLTGFDGGPVTGLATRWVDGPDLREAALGLPLEGRMRLFAGVLDAVAYLHRRGLLHLDLKPENVVVGEDGEPVLLDLGSARPLHAGPGEAGGTLGYASPEVLRGEAPTAASDVYGLGAVLYELLAGRPPFGKAAPDATRRAMLSEDPPSLRIVAPDVPRALVKVVDDLLARDPVRRPASPDDVRDRIASAGFAIALTTHGSPSFVGRDIELDSVRAVFQSERTGIAVVIGPQGSGRARLIRRAASEWPRRFLDLGRASSPPEAAYRLLLAVDSRVPPRRPGWWHGYEALSGALGEPVVFLGRRERSDRADLEELDALAAAMARGGALVVWASEELVPGAQSVALAPLSRPEMERIAREVGGADVAPAVEAARGHPGLLLEALSLSSERINALPAEVAELHRVLSAFPMPVPAAVLARWEPALRSDLARLAAAGLGRWEPGGGLTVVGAQRGAIEGRWRDLVLPCLADARVAPAWAVVAACRAGEVEIARELLPRAEDLAPDARIEVLEFLVAAGDRDLRLPLAKALVGRQRLDRAAEVLDLPDPSGEEVAWRGRALRRGGRKGDAESWLSAHVLGSASVAAWCELARTYCLQERLDEAEEALRQGRELDPQHPWIPGTEVSIAAARVRNGAGAEILLRALDAVRGETSVSALTAAARALRGVGRHEEAVETLRRAIAAAEAAGDTWTATTARATLGRSLRELKRTAEARQAYGEALAMAFATGDLQMVLNTAYQLCLIEKQSERLSAAEHYLAIFDRTAAQTDIPQAVLRGTFLRAGLAFVRGDPAAVIRALEPVSSPDVGLMFTRAGYLAEAELALGRPEAALARLELPAIDAYDPRGVNLIRGRAHLAIARAELARVEATIPAGDPDPAERREVGEALLAIAGEDLDPLSFAKRREMLARAAPLLRGESAARAADLRDRLHDAPSTTLESLAQLAESAHDPQLLAAALARLVGEALGAHRVVIVLRIPGLGERVTWRELSSGVEAAGIVSDVTQRIRTPDDVWLAEDAFSDPAVRQASRTVRDFGIKSVVAVAIPLGERVIGALYADDVVRAGRFGPREVEVLQRLARAVGRMVSRLPGVADAGEDPFAEPEDVHGVLLSDAKQIQAVRGTLELLRGQRASNMLVTGATGAGKTWFARRVATEVLGAQGLVELVLRRTDADKMVAQLGGVKKGEYTSAIDAMGVIEKAIRERKALFLDEIQALDDEGQQAILPLLELPIRRFGGILGDAAPLRGPLHVIVGTNVDVSGTAWRRKFREDLWWRMAQNHVHLPSLAERGPEVVYRYLRQMLAQHGAGAPDEVFELAALHTVTRHEWPGNLRMLDSFAQKAAKLRAASGRPLVVEDLARIGIGQDQPVRQVGLDALTSKAVLRALNLSGWNQKEAARVLGITRFRLLRLLKSYGLLDEVRRRRKEPPEPPEPEPTR